MTDEEIEKGLEACANGICKKCTYHEYNDCLQSLIEDSFAYTKRLKARKEKIRKETAKEILQKLWNLQETITDEDGYTGQFIFVENIHLFEKKYGIEVEE